MTDRVIRERESGSPRSYTNLLNRINPPPPLLESPPFCPAHGGIRISATLIDCAKQRRRSPRSGFNPV